MTRAAPRWLKPATEYGPLAVFLAVYAWAGLMPATAALLAATGVGLVLSLLLLRRLPLMPLVTAAVVGVFGGLTLWLHDDTRSEEHTSELQSLMRISYAVFCLKKKMYYDVPYTQYK